MAFMSQRQPQRTSFASRVSTMFERRRAPAPDVESARATTTFEVPLFLSPSRYQQPHVQDDELYDDHDDNYDDHDIQSHSSTRSLTRGQHHAANGIRPIALSTSSRYSSRPASPAAPQPAVLPFDETSLISSLRSSEQTMNHPRSTKVVTRHRRRRKNSLKSKVDGLVRVSAVFGITLLITLITYLVLAATGTGSGIMFHVLMILLILSLTGVFVHSTIRFVILSKKLKARRAERRRGNLSRDRAYGGRQAYFGEVYQDPSGPGDALAAEKPIRIFTAEDEEANMDPRSAAHKVKYPPPVYGNFRSSKRIDPSLVHWQKVPPSPLTPTYDEAMSDVHRVMGYRPPSYVQSESGATHVVEQGREDVDQALKHIHPLDRPRVSPDNMI